MRTVFPKSIAVSVLILSLCAVLGSQKLPNGTSPKSPPLVPRMWDDQAMSTLEVPSANPIGSAKHAPSAYYYKIPVQSIYKSYPIYAPGHEPPGYMEWLKKQGPEIVWDATHRPPLHTDRDWIRAGEIVFDASTAFHNLDVTPDQVRSPAWYQATGVSLTKGGVMPFQRYIIRKKGEIEVSGNSCASCHTRVMPDGTVLKGAQGNFPLDRVIAYRYRASVAVTGNVADALRDVRDNERYLYATPWVRPDPLAGLDKMSAEELASRHDTIPPGVGARHGTNVLYPVQVPDLIGVKDRRFLDRTGLQQHRGIVDLMRYAALNQGGDAVSSFDGFIPADYGHFKKLPPPADTADVGDRFSDEQLYALALYLYSLHPPDNPSKFDAFAARGQKVFEREGCGVCHTPPLYTDNKLTPAEGFTPPPGAAEKYAILPLSVGTDPNLALSTRRGTGYYKVPSLRGVWYRSMFGHSGWCATLEDWFDPDRLNDNFVPTGFKPYGAKTYAVKGHTFGLDLSDADRKALIAFLKTL
jgi:hypothetical protein